MNHAYFLTGTDTEIGKTFITCALLHRARQLGLRAAGIKPVAAGTNAEGKNEDVEAIRAAGNVALPPAVINPYCFKAAIAPHLAAAEAGIAIDFAHIIAACATARQQSDLLIVEGVGGFRVPLGVEPRQRRPRRRPRPAADPRRRPAPRLHQPRAAHRRGDRRARPDAGRLGRQPDRPGDGPRRRQHRRPARTAWRAAARQRATHRRQQSGRRRIVSRTAAGCLTTSARKISNGYNPAP